MLTRFGVFATNSNLATACATRNNKAPLTAPQRTRPRRVVALYHGEGTVAVQSAATAHSAAGERRGAHCTACSRRARAQQGSREAKQGAREAEQGTRAGGERCKQGALGRLSPQVKKQVAREEAQRALEGPPTKRRFACSHSNSNSNSNSSLQQAWARGVTGAVQKASRRVTGAEAITREETRHIEGPPQRRLEGEGQGEGEGQAARGVEGQQEAGPLGREAQAGRAHTRPQSRRQP